jgi:hypothetical protein
MQALSESVKQSEPGTLKYEINVETKASGAQELVVVEMSDSALNCMCMWK